MIDHVRFKMLVGFLPWFAMMFFIMAIILPNAEQMVCTIVALCLPLIFVCVAPFLRLSSNASFQRRSGMIVFSLGCILLVLLKFASGVVEMLAAPGGIIGVGVGIIILGDAILMDCFLRDRAKSRIRLFSMIFALIIITAGPILIGLQIIYLLEHLDLPGSAIRQIFHMRMPV